MIDMPDITLLLKRDNLPRGLTYLRNRHGKSKQQDQNEINNNQFIQNDLSDSIQQNSQKFKNDEQIYQRPINNKYKINIQYTKNQSKQNDYSKKYQQLLCQRRQKHSNSMEISPNISIISQCLLNNDNVIKPKYGCNSSTIALDYNYNLNAYDQDAGGESLCHSQNLHSKLDSRKFKFNMIQCKRLKNTQDENEVASKNLLMSFFVRLQQKYQQKREIKQLVHASKAANCIIEKYNSTSQEDAQVVKISDYSAIQKSVTDNKSRELLKQQLQSNKLTSQIRRAVNYQNDRYYKSSFPNNVPLSSNSITNSIRLKAGKNLFIQTQQNVIGLVKSQQYSETPSTLDKLSFLKEILLTERTKTIQNLVYSKYYKHPFFKSNDVSKYTYKKLYQQPDFNEIEQQIMKRNFELKKEINDMEEDRKKRPFPKKIKIS